METMHIMELILPQAGFMENPVLLVLSWFNGLKDAFGPTKLYRQWPKDDLFHFEQKQHTRPTLVTSLLSK